MNHKRVNVLGEFVGASLKILLVWFLVGAPEWVFIEFCRGFGHEAIFGTFRYRCTLRAHATI